MDQPQHVSQMLDNLRQQLEGQLAQLNQRRQQLQQNIQQEEVVDPATRAQVAQQQDVLQNLRYEAELLNEKLMKLRANRQLIESELFQLKDKRIKLLEDINKLEDEEMQLVSEVNRLMTFKRNLLQEVPYFEERARVSASLAVVQDYLAASVSHLQHHQAASSSGAALLGGLTPTAGANLSSPSWHGTANVRRPSATWISMPPPTTASSSSLTTRGSGTSSIPPTPTGQPPTAAEPRGTALVEAGPSLSAGLGLAGAAEAMQLLSLEQQQQWHQQGVQQQQAQQSAFPPEAGRRMNYSPFGVVSPEGLLKMQQLDANTAEGLPTVPEGQPLSAGDSVEITTPLGSLETALGLTRSMTAPSRSGSFQSQGSAAAAESSYAGARMLRESISSTSETSSDSATRFSRGMLASSGSIRSDWRSGASGALDTGSFTSSTVPAVPRRSDDDSAAVFSAGEAAAAARGPSAGAEQQIKAAAEAAVPKVPPPALRPAPTMHPAAAVAPPMPRQASSVLSAAQPPPPPRRARSMTLPGTLPFQEQRQQHPPPPPTQHQPSQLRLQQGKYQEPGMSLQQKAVQSPQPHLLVQQHQPSSEHTQQPTVTIPQLQHQIAQIAQAQAQLSQQQQQALILGADVTPVSRGLSGAVDTTGAAAAAAGSSTSMSGFTTTALGWNPPSVNMPVRVSAGQPGGLTAADAQLWIMPTGNVAVLQPDRPSAASGDSTQLPTPAADLSLQQVQVLAAAGSTAAAAAARSVDDVAGGRPHLPVGSGPVVMLSSLTGQSALAPTPLYVQQTPEDMRLVQGQQLTSQQLGAHQSPGLQVTGQQRQQQLPAGQQ